MSGNSQIVTNAVACESAARVLLARRGTVGREQLRGAREIVAPEDDHLDPLAADLPW